MTEERFKTKLSKKQKRENILGFLAVIICSYLFVLLFGFFIGAFDGWSALVILTVGLVLSFYILSMLQFPMIILAAVLGTQVGKARRIHDDSTFVPVQNIDYYRDTLDEINPAIASLLIDLDIYGKDIVATLLRMQNKKAIFIKKNGDIGVTTTNTKELDNSETGLLKLIETKKLNDKRALLRWKQNRFQEAERLGYIQKKAANKDKTMDTYIVIAVFGVFIAIILWGVFLSSDLYRVKSVFDFIKMSAWLLMADVFSFVPFYIAFKKKSYRFRGDVLWERTALGNEMAEKIAGLLRFIHEFSILSEAEKEQAVLWDDYLVYAIVLEENEKIVGEISKQYKIDLRSFDKPHIAIE